MDIRYKRTYKIDNFKTEEIEVHVSDEEFKKIGFDGIRGMVETIHMRSLHIDSTKKMPKKTELDKGACKGCINYSNCIDDIRGVDRCSNYEEEPF